MGTVGNQKNLRILQQFQENNRNQLLPSQYFGSDSHGGHQSKEKAAAPGQYLQQHKSLSSKYQYSHYIDHESTRTQNRDREM